MKALTQATQDLLKPVPLAHSDRLKLQIDNDGAFFWARITTADADRPYASSLARRRWPLIVPERKELTGRIDEWNFAVTDITVAVIVATWPREQIIFMDEDTELTFNFVEAQILSYDQNVETVARYKEQQIVPNGLRLNPDAPLNPYQQVGATCLRRSDGYGLFMATGTGKTPVVISTIDNEAPKVNAAEKRMHRTLIVCPNSVRTNWVEEVGHFTTLKGKVTVLRGGQVDRIKLLIDALSRQDEEQFTVVIVSYQTMVRMVESLRTIEWDLIALDESHNCKWPTTKQSLSALKLRDSASKRAILTATPVGNTILDLYSQLEFLGRGYSGFQSWKAFRTFYGSWEKTSHGDKLVGIQNLPFMRERLARYSFIISKEEALPFLPKKSYEVLETEMGTKQADIYEQVRDELVAKLERDMEASETKSLMVNNMLTQLLRLAQITAGFIPWDAEFDDEGNQVKGRDITIFEENHKIDAMIEALKQKDPTEKSIIWCCWVPMIREIERRLKAEGITPVMIYGGVKQSLRDEAVNAFNFEPSVQVMVANQACAGAGLNLYGFPPHEPDLVNTNCNQNFWYAQDWSLIKRSQGEDRNHRYATRVPIMNTDMMTPGTIDEQIRERVVKKKKSAAEISDVKDILQAVLTGNFRNV